LTAGNTRTRGLHRNRGARSARAEDGSLRGAGGGGDAQGAAGGGGIGQRELCVPSPLVITFAVTPSPAVFLIAVAKYRAYCWTN